MVKRTAFYMQHYIQKIMKIDIYELMEHAEGLINSASSAADDRNKGHAVLKRLIDGSLLLKCDESIDNVKMHDVI